MDSFETLKGTAANTFALVGVLLQQAWVIVQVESSQTPGLASFGFMRMNG